MKAQVLLPLAALAAVVSGCAGTSMMSGTASYGDDLYYDHSKAPVKASAPLASTAPVNVPAYQRNVATYSGASDSYSSVADSRDFSDIQSYYSQSNKAAVVDTVEIPADEAEDGYWAGGFWGSSSDQSYAERMIRFHAPFIGISYYSPLYTDAVYFGRGDWNVYVTGGDAYLVPTWGNPYYNDFYFGLGFNWRRNHLRWSFGWGLGLGWGWGYAGIYDPWYDPWYCGPYYGWGSPYYGGYYHHHHHYHHGPAHAPGHGHYAFNNRGYHYGQRGVSTTVGSRSAGSVRGTTTTTIQQCDPPELHAHSHQPICVHTHGRVVTHHHRSADGHGSPQHYSGHHPALDLHAKRDAHALVVGSAQQFDIAAGHIGRARQFVGWQQLPQQRLVGSQEHVDATQHVVLHTIAQQRFVNHPQQQRFVGLDDAKQWRWRDAKQRRCYTLVGRRAPVIIPKASSHDGQPGAAITVRPGHQPKNKQHTDFLRL